ncbi:MAG: NAD(P)-dependent oxidoreductase [Rubrivivax sp.]
MSSSSACGPAPAVHSVGLIGLGIMGGRMARALIEAGHRVCGHDPLAARRQALRRAGGQALAGNAEVARQAEVLVSSLPTSAALREVVEALGQVPPPVAGQLFIETSTLPLADKMWAAQALRRQGRTMVDGPISGTATPTPQEVWIMYLSGTVAACRRAAPVVRAFTLQAPRVGALGAGTRLKFAANHLVAIYNVAYAEMVTLCRCMGLDPAVALEHMGHSPYIGTGAMRLRMPLMIERRYEPATMKIDLWQKDMRVIGDQARAVGCPTPLFDACAAIYTAAAEGGLGELDTAAAAEVLAMQAGEAHQTGQTRQQGQQGQQARPGARPPRPVRLRPAATRV